MLLSCIFDNFFKHLKKMFFFCTLKSLRSDTSQFGKDCPTILVKFLAFTRPQQIDIEMYTDCFHFALVVTHLMLRKKGRGEPERNKRPHLLQQHFWSLSFILDGLFSTFRYLFSWIPEKQKTKVKHFSGIQTQIWAKKQQS